MNRPPHIQKWLKMVRDVGGEDLARGGLYQVFKGRQMMYLGSAIMFKRRLTTHTRRDDFMEAGADCITVIPYDSWDNCLLDEIVFIRLHRPILNRCFYTNPRSKCNVNRKQEAYAERRLAYKSQFHALRPICIP